MKRAGVLIAAVVVSGLGALPARSEEPALTTRTFKFTYEVRLPKAPDGTKRLDAWVPTPIEDEIQQVADFKVETTSGGAAVPNDVCKDEPYQNRVVHVGVDEPKAEVVIRWSATITRAEDVGQGTGPVLDRFKEADKLVPITGRASDIAKKLGADKSDAPVEQRAKLVYDDVLGTMTYDKVAPGWGKGDFERACDVGKGNCTDFHAKFTGIARAAGIPVRFTMGIPLSKEPKGTAGGYHCWAHYHNGSHWLPIDASEAQKIQAKDPAKAQWFFGHLDPDRISLTIGRDLTLCPKQKGDPLLFFAYPYVEIDGKANNDFVPKENRSFTWEDVAK